MNSPGRPFQDASDPLGRPASPSAKLELFKSKVILQHVHSLRSKG